MAIDVTMRLFRFACRRRRGPVKFDPLITKLGLRWPYEGRRAHLPVRLLS